MVFVFTFWRHRRKDNYTRKEIASPPDSTSVSPLLHRDGLTMTAFCSFVNFEIRAT